MIKRIKYTKPFLKAVSTAYLLDFQEKLERTLTKFPELEADYIHVGKLSYFGCVAIARTSEKDRIKISYNTVNKATYLTFGHELTHFIQRLGIIPHGEKPCDIWTLARDPIFLDRPPFYLRIPARISDNWSIYAAKVRALCIEAIEQRANGRRQYIVWLENEIKGLF
jgi:hypothetical protein